MTTEVASVARKVALYLGGEPAGHGEHPSMPTEAIPPLCRQHDCSLRMIYPDAGDTFGAQHVTGQGHEHTFDLPKTFLEDVDADIWGEIQGRITDVHGSLGML